MARFPQHRENVPTGRCSDCNVDALLVGHWGPKQERKLCSGCDETAFKKLLAETGRLASYPWV